MNDNRQNTTINWFPGHMAKALKQIKEKIQLVDLIIEIIDARAIISTKNPLLEEICKNKTKLTVVNKIDLADDNVTKQWMNVLPQPHVFVNLNQKNSIQMINTKIKALTKQINEKDIKRGLKPKMIRVMIVGIPNVGKSTFINSLSKRKSTGVANRPGFTKAQQWIHTADYDLLDTPGVLWPSLQDNQANIKLALMGCIKNEILPLLDLCQMACEILENKYPNLLYNKYGILYKGDFYQYINAFAQKMGHLFKQNELDLERSCNFILNDLKNGNIGKISWEWINDGKF